MPSLLRPAIEHVSIEQVAHAQPKAGVPLQTGSDPCPGLRLRSINLRFSAKSSPHSYAHFPASLILATFAWCHHPLLSSQSSLAS
jgi:hypothetical protein